MREMGTLLVDGANLIGPRGCAVAVDRRERLDADAITEEVTKLEGRVDDPPRYRPEGTVPQACGANAMDFIVGAEIYDHLEKVADRCR